MKVLISEKLSEHKYKTPEGYLICTDAILARTGKQSYTKDELFQDGDNTEVNVDRPYDEVMNAKTIASFENKPITFDHPDEDVNVGNYKDYAIGYVRDVHQGKTDKGEDVILGNLVITDQDAINAIEQGDHTDLSCGYDCDIRDDGDGKYSQTNIRGNHLALCEQGRAGIARIVDSKVEDAAIGGHYKNNRGENFFICSYGSGFSIFKADGEYLDGSKHLSLDGVKQRILYYNLTKVKDSAKDSIMKDESEDWTEMLIKLAVKNGKNSSGDYEYDGDADVNQVRRVLKKLGYKDNGYVKNPKSYLHKLHYYFTDSEILEDMSSDPVVVEDGNYSEKEIKEAAMKLLKQKPFLTYEEALQKVKENIRNGNYLLDNKIEDSMNYSEEMKAVRNALRHIVVDNKSEMKQLIQDLIDNKPMNYSLEVRRLKRAIDELIKWSDNRQEGIDTIWAIAKENRIVDSKVEDNMNDAKDSKEMTMSDAIKMLNIVDAYKKAKTFAKDSYIVVRNKSKYEDAARKLGLTIEKDSKSLRIYGDRYKLKQLQNQFDNDEEISYVVIKDASKDKWVIKNTGLAYEIWNQGKMVKKFPTKKLAIEWIHSRFPTDEIIEDSTKDGRLWQTLTRKAKH